MSVVINTNYSATVAANNLNTSNSMLQKSLNRLSSGTKIVNPADDAGGLAVSMKLSAAARRQGAVSTNIGNSTSYLQTQDGALKVAGKVLDRMSELKTLYNDPTKNSSDLSNYDSEFTSLQKQLTALTSEKFNGVALFGTSSLTVAATEDGGSSTSITLAGRDLSSSSTGIGAITASGITSLGSSSLSLSTITDAIQNVATMRASNGAEQSRLSFASELLTTNKANLEAANSRIMDVDVAEESTQLARFNTLVQAGTAMLAQANSSASTALRLLQ
ncbi:MAG TPA: flagellin [Opitutaceae bacterium]|nr:flagellin [Opitutaceae bacterium]